MKKILGLVIAIFAMFIFTGCIAVNAEGQKGIKGHFTGHVYTKEDAKKYKKIFDDGKHIVLQVKEEIAHVKQDSKKTD